MGEHEITKILFYGHAGSKNHGCEAIIRSTSAILRKVSIEVPISLGTFRRHEDEKFNIDSITTEFVDHKIISKWSLTHLRLGISNRLYDTNASSKYINKAIMNCINQHTIAMSIGGDNYCYGYPANWIYLNKASKEKGANTVLWGCSIEPELFKYQEVIEDMNKYDIITARESITYEALVKAGVNKSTHLFPDPAFVLEVKTLPLPKGFDENNTIGLNVSPLIMRLEKSDNITYNNFCRLVQYVIETTDMQIALIPHVTWENNNDLEPLTALYDKFKVTGRVCLIGEQYNCMELKGFISRCRFFVGARTHATIAAYSTCVPTLVVGYSVKARGIARDIFGSEENMVVPVQSLEHEDDLVNAFKHIQENEDDIRRHLQEFMPSYIEKAWQAGEEVKKLIEK